jgi:hypothetical protein
MSPDSPAKALARFLTEREVQTPYGRSTVWQATTVQRMRTRWSNQMECPQRLHKLTLSCCTSLCVRLMGPLGCMGERIGLARFKGGYPR